MTAFEPLKCLHVAGGRDAWVIRKSNGSNSTGGFKDDFEFIAYDGHPESQVYARLFAAAPTMLTALKQIEQQLDYGQHDAALKTARAIIAKAKE